MLISSTDNKRIKEARKLLEKKYSLEKGLFLIEGDHAVKEALKKNLITELYLLEGNNDSYDFDSDIDKNYWTTDYNPTKYSPWYTVQSDVYVKDSICHIRIKEDTKR